MKQQRKLNNINKVVMITPTWNITIGGTAKVVYNLVKGIQVLNPAYKVHIITSDCGEDGDSDVSYMGNGMVSKVFRIIKILRHFRPGVIHCHGRIHYLLISYIYKILFDVNVKLICSFYTQPPSREYLPKTLFTPKKSKLKRIKKEISTFILNRTDWVVANSNSLAENIKVSSGFMLRNPVKMIPSGVEAYNIHEKDVHDFVEKYSLQNAYPVFSTVGVFQWDWKVAGILVLLKAFQEVVKQYPISRLVLVGDGQYRGLIEENIEQLNVKEHVVMTGNVSNTFIPLAVTDIYCHMALNESCSVSILEAMISGKPIIAAAAGGNSDLINDGETGILVEPEVESLRQAMLDLAQNRELAAKLGHTACVVARENYNWNVITEKYLQLYLN